MVRATPLLRQVLPDPTAQADGSWHVRTETGNQLWCHGRDLRELSKSPSQDSPAILAGLRTDVPTLLISECCLCYQETSEAKAVIEWFTSKIPSIGILIYEPIRPDDAFGRVMVSNLAARDIAMPTLAVYKERGDQETRLKDAGFDSVRQMTVDEAWDRWVPAEEKERVNSLEGLDEVEEWHLLARHYIIAWGWRGGGFGPWLEL